MCYTLEEIKEKTTPIAVSYGIQSLGVFGSYARGEATDESDVDICVEKGSLRRKTGIEKLLEKFLEAYNQIPWHAIKGMRNLHAHDYERVDLSIVWNTLKEDIPDFMKQLETILGE